MRTAQGIERAVVVETRGFHDESVAFPTPDRAGPALEDYMHANHRLDSSDGVH